MRQAGISLAARENSLVGLACEGISGFSAKGFTRTATPASYAGYAGCGFIVTLTCSQALTCFVLFHSDIRAKDRLLTVEAYSEKQSHSN